MENISEEKYVLCDSSTEEGEITPETLKKYKMTGFGGLNSSSVLKYLYYPLTDIFIGHNSIPRMSDYFGTQISPSIKKKLKKDFPAPFAILSLNKDRAFFQNKLMPFKELERNNAGFMLVSIINNVNEHESVFEHINKSGKDTYNEVFNNFSYDDKKEEAVQGITSHKKKRFILIKDSILDKINTYDCYVYFKVLKSKEAKTIIFEDYYYRKIPFYKYLDLYAEEVLKYVGSSEIRSYVNDDTFLSIYSSSLFTNKGKMYRFFNGVDVANNFIALVNAENIEAKRISFINSKLYEYISGIDYEEGNYVIHNLKVFKMGFEGITNEFEGVCYDDFCKC